MLIDLICIFKAGKKTVLELKLAGLAKPVLEFKVAGLAKPVLEFKVMGLAKPVLEFKLAGLAKPVLQFCWRVFVGILIEKSFIRSYFSV